MSNVAKQTAIQWHMDNTKIAIRTVGADGRSDYSQARHYTAAEAEAEVNHRASAGLPLLRWNTTDQSKWTY